MGHNNTAISNRKILAITGLCPSCHLLWNSRQNGLVLSSPGEGEHQHKPNTWHFVRLPKWQAPVPESGQTMVCLDARALLRTKDSRLPCYSRSLQSRLDR